MCSTSAHDVQHAPSEPDPSPYAHWQGCKVARDFLLMCVAREVTIQHSHNHHFVGLCVLGGSPQHVMATWTSTKRSAVVLTSPVPQMSFFLQPLVRNILHKPPRTHRSSQDFHAFWVPDLGPKSPVPSGHTDARFHAFSLFEGGFLRVYAASQSVVRHSNAACGFGREVHIVQVSEKVFPSFKFPMSLL